MIVSYLVLLLCTIFIYAFLDPTVEQLIYFLLAYSISGILIEIANKNIKI